MDDKTQDNTSDNGVDETAGMENFSEPEVIKPNVDPSAPPTVLRTEPEAPASEPVASDSQATSTPTASSETPASVSQTTDAALPFDPLATNSTAPAATLNANKGSMKKKLVLPLVLAAVLLFGGGAAAYVTVFQKTPEKLWSRALSNTVDGLDTMLKTSLAQDNKGTKMEGSIKVESPVVVDATMNGSLYETNGTFSADVSASGVRMNAEVRSITQEGAKTPDIYVKVDGLDQIGALLGTGIPGELEDTVATINNQWFYLDHTLIDQYLSSVGTEENEMNFSKEVMDKISDKLMVVMRDRFFASDDKGVFTVTEKVGKEPMTLLV
jgi:hypothetical protein